MFLGYERSQLFIISFSIALSNFFFVGRSTNSYSANYLLKHFRQVMRCFSPFLFAFITTCECRIFQALFPPNYAHQKFQRSLSDATYKYSFFFSKTSSLFPCSFSGILSTTHFLLQSLYHVSSKFFLQTNSLSFFLTPALKPDRIFFNG